MLDNRYGRFRITRTVLQEMTDPERHALFEGLTVLSADNDFMSDSILYGGHHPDFAPILPGGIIMEYKVVLTRDEHGVVTRRFERA